MPPDNRAYYDNNTPIFLRVGDAGRSLSIHRALWGAGVTTRAQALDYTHSLLAGQARQLEAPPARLLDLGCGVGGTLLSLSRQLPGTWRGLGVTISPVQAGLANRYARQAGLSDRLDFLVADFARLPGLQGIDFAWSVEAFILSADPQAYFTQVRRVLRPGGRLVIVDDFLSPSGTALDLPAAARNWIEQFRRGWHVPGFTSASAVMDCAAQCGLRLREVHDLTPLWRRGTLRDQAVALTVRLGRLLRLRGLYWDSLVGGDALTRIAQAGLSQYRMLVFEADSRK
jgi:cyclopropane fatty-acyl-phospholipid synthase-like methyltransferase